MGVDSAAVTGRTRVLGIIGHPVGHSLSPLMQNAALRACGLDFIYVPFQVTPETLGEAVAGMRALGVAGFNVTIPHKVTIMPLLDRLDESADAAGAVNTVRNEEGVLVGYNTDGDGLLRSLVTEFGFEPRGARVALVGAGGAARGALAALCRAGTGRIFVANRSREHAEELIAQMRLRYPASEIMYVGSAGDLERFLDSTDVLVNTTSVGMNPDDGPVVRLEKMTAGACVYDMVYAPPATPLLVSARERGLRCANGLGMLAAQGELGFALWTGILPPEGLMADVLSEWCEK